MGRAPRCDGRIQDVFARGDGPTRKALLKTLIAEIKVGDRHTIRPFFYVPTVTSTNKPLVEGPTIKLASSVRSWRDR